MKHSYRCDSCGCYLDPGEGLLCDECREKTRIRIKRADTYKELVAESRSGQYEMRLQEAM